MQWKCPRGTFHCNNHPKVDPNPDIWVGSASAREEKDKMEAEEARDSRGPEEKRSVNQEERNQEEDDQGEEWGKGFIGETPIPPRPLDKRTLHVPGGAWLSQVRSYLRFSHFLCGVGTGVRRA
ncbi:hypothetical protein NDU88_003281 [Pleurodeles waltl]|uniref:Uncharacterized protein n=1 Tax=Pleurodeles waltl TaxID=8319 RepID=A0AAV7UZP8_PLEWA|nr:hypothetical protein NDU88_003281 [Pleurodeles waltl]